MRNVREYIVYIGTYTQESSEGIYVYRFDRRSAELIHLYTVSDVENPSFLAIDSQQRFLYAVHELNEYQGQRTGAVRSFRIDPSTWNLDRLSEQPSFGEHPCHVAVHPQDNLVLLANYTSGSVSLFPVVDGVLQTAGDTAQHVGSGPNLRRQKGPHAHSVTFSPDGRYVYAADLGIDKLMIYRMDTEKGVLIPNNPQHVSTSPGAGPRHMTFHPNGKYAYVINELNSTITAYRYDPQSGGLEEFQTLSTLPDTFTGNNTCADIHTTPDGRFLYGSNRGHDSLVICKVDKKSGILSVVGRQSVLGETPRNFAVDPAGEHVLVANQNSDSIVVFRINKRTGLLTDTGNRTKVSMPVCVKMISP